MTIGWGIIGIGDLANRVMAPTFNKATNARLVAVCSRSMERARDFAARHGAERAYDSLEKMLADPELDALYIGTPNNLHAREAIQAAEAGKHILCDKPMTLTVDDAERMIQTAEKHKVKLAVGYQQRYHPVHMEARRYVQSGIAGEITTATAQYCRVVHLPKESWRNDPVMAGAGALMGQGVHGIDLLRYIMDSEITEVQAMTDREPPHRPVDEMVFATLKFENGAYGTVMAGIRADRTENDIKLYGSRAKITCKGTCGRPMGNLGEFLVDGESLNTKMTFPTDNPLLTQYVGQVEAFQKWIGEGIEPHITGENGLRMVRITNAVIESSQKGKAIKLTH